MQFPHGLSKAKCLLGLRLNSGARTFDLGKDAVCCAGATEFEKAQKWLLLIAQIKRCL